MKIRAVRVLKGTCGLALFGALALSCTIDYLIVFGSRDNGMTPFPNGFNCASQSDDGGVTVHRFIESAITDGGAVGSLSLTLVADFVSVDSSLAGVRADGICRSAEKIAGVKNCTLLPSLRSCIEIADVPTSYRRSSGVTVDVDGGFGSVLHDVGWNFTAGAQPPDSNIFIRMVALRGVSCAEIPMGIDASQTDLDDRFHPNIVGCVDSPMLNLHDSPSQIALTLPNQSGYDDCTSCEMFQCVRIFDGPVCGQ